MEPISDRAAEALADHRARTGFGPGRKDAVRERLEASIAAGAAADFVAELDQAAAEEGTGVSPDTAAGRRARIGGMLALALAAGLAGVWWVSADAVREQGTQAPPAAAYEGEASPTTERATARPPKRPVATPAPAREAETTEALEVPAPPEPASPPTSERARPRKSTPATAAATAPAEPAESTLAAELRLLREARAAVGRGDRKAALANLDRHAKQFPHGQLEPERAALRVEVLCALDSERGERARDSFLARFGGSGHAKRVRALTCRSTD